MKNKILSGLFESSGLLMLLALLPATGLAQENLSLENAVNMALQNNHLLNVKKLQVNEKEQKVNEDKVKYFPSVTIGGSYQYNSNLPALTIEQGRFGQLPFGGVLIPLPAIDEIIEMGNHNIYNAGVSFYQPVLQIGKIGAGVQVSRMELEIARTEQTRAVFQLKQAVEKLYFGLLILEKQIQEAEIKVILAKTKLYDAENALAAGKTTGSGIYGLSAASADEEQSLLKLRMQYDDYSDELKHLTGIDQDEPVRPEPIPSMNLIADISAAGTSAIKAGIMNNDLKIASLLRTKADYSIKASRFSYLPDLGIQGGYTYQEGSIIYPKNNTFIGASLKWNLQDVFFNRTIQKQRIFVREEAEEILANTKDQVSKDLAKAYRKLKQSEELITVAGKAAEFRREDLKLQIDRHESGLTLESDVLAAKAAMAKAESDYFSAQLNYRIALSELKILTGTY